MYLRGRPSVSTGTSTFRGSPQSIGSDKMIASTPCVSRLFAADWSPAGSSSKVFAMLSE